MRSQRKSIFSLNTHNKVLWAAMIGSFALTVALLYVPFLRNAFGFTAISVTEFAIALGIAVLVIPIVEIVKLIQRKVKK
jgi:Ca2+-transporting ATPase